MLVSSIFSFSHNVSYHLKKNFCFLITLILSSANAFNLDQSKNLSFGKGLTSDRFSPHRLDLPSRQYRPKQNAYSVQSTLIVQFPFCLMAMKGLTCHHIKRQISVLGLIFFSVCKVFQFGLGKILSFDNSQFDNSHTYKFQKSFAITI